MPPLFTLKILLYVENLASVVVTAGFAYAVGHVVSAAVRARNDTGRFELPDAAASLVSSGL